MPLYHIARHSLKQVCSILYLWKHYRYTQCLSYLPDLFRLDQNNTTGSPCTINRGRRSIFQHLNRFNITSIYITKIQILSRHTVQTIKGLTPPEREDNPRICTVAPSAGLPPFVVICTPAIFPCNDFMALAEAFFFKSLALAIATEPVKSAFFCVI